MTQQQSLGNEFLAAMRSMQLSDQQIKRMIDRLDISADSKAMLHGFAKATIQVGAHVIKIGRKLIDYVCAVFKEFPKATFGIVFGTIIAALLASIPLLGAVLAPIATPILIALGLVMGTVEDWRDQQLERKIKEIQAELAPLKTVQA